MRAAWDRFYENSPRPWAGAIELPALGPGWRVLEAGCGGGRLLLPLIRSRPDLSLTGVDFSKTALQGLARQCPGLLVRADLAALPFGDQSFDAVLCRHVLEHLDTEGRQDSASEMLRVVRPGGRIFFEGFSVNDARFGKGRQVEPSTFVRGDGISYHYFTSQEVGRLFANASSVNPRERTWDERAGPARMKRAVIVAEIQK
jgi:ubiquinone/menaquinone biosynthesis C-methylase UbiE